MDADSALHPPVIDAVLEDCDEFSGGLHHKHVTPADREDRVG
jgi:hypothetical protein